MCKALVKKMTSDAKQALENLYMAWNGGAEQDIDKIRALSAALCQNPTFDMFGLSVDDDENKNILQKIAIEHMEFEYLYNLGLVEERSSKQYPCF